MNWQASSGTALSLPTVDPQLLVRNLPGQVDSEHEWVCVLCHNRVASERDRFRLEGRDEFIFSNPEGIRFEIITFSRGIGCLQTGLPTLEHTWFPGYAWSYCQCAECAQHLGWFYTGARPFVGFIKPRIVRAQLLRN